MLEAISYLTYMEKRSRMVPCQEEIIPRRYSGATQAFLTRNFRRLIFHLKKTKKKIAQYSHMFVEKRVQN